VSRGLASKRFFRSFHSLGWQHLLTFLHPELLGSPRDGTYAAVELWEDVAYFGLVPLLLAIAGGTLGWRRPRVLFLVVSFVVSTLVALDTPLVRFLYDTLPGFRLFHLPGRLLFLTSCFGIALAGVGLEEILARLRGASGTVWRTALVGGTSRSRRGSRRMSNPQPPPRRAWHGWWARQTGFSKFTRRASREVFS